MVALGEKTLNVINTAYTFTERDADIVLVSPFKKPQSSWTTRWEFSMPISSDACC